MKTFESACTLLPEPPPHPGRTAELVPAPAIFWHRELPPLDAVFLGEHVVEATSARVPGTVSRSDKLWPLCYRDLMRRTSLRLRREIERLGGRYAHILEESISSRHDDATGEGWLTGRFTYTLLR